MNFYEHHIGDFDQATAHLSAVEDGIYSRMIRWYMADERPLPVDVSAIQRRVRAHSRDEKAAVKTVLAEFFELREDGHHQKRCDEELARYQDKQRKARASAEARWGRSERNADASPNDDAPDMRTHAPSIDTGHAPRARTPAPADARSSPQSPVPSPQTPTEPSVPPGGARGSRLAPDWHPGESGLAFASQQGLGTDKTALELAKFRDYWASRTGKDATKADWQATWRNWVRKAAEYTPRAAGAPTNRQQQLEDANRAVGERWASQQEIGHGTP